ncbi:DUF6193 family natural product biosynthesis protein [Streptomyces sp. TLI_171]|uniref:DUF6193 family natural product biosynthesis protein n=1 Tax=Streptomyces sp. TLI_171 TaxID=1938859 RepID=UPI000C18C6E8|nr:DUF6193 family natural product biosynthesis protein [Streptomyces sp. TLI_171]RKE18928.1 hypothetical protein BX266_2224 [Streptomyces sp. TLI_171]
MDARQWQRRCRGEWAELVQAWGPERDHGWVGPSLHRLLELAVAEPTLMRLWPYTSMNVLGLSATGDFRDYGQEPFPAVTCWEGGYRVLAAPGARGEPVLETTDPAEALACLVGMLD